MRQLRLLHVHRQVGNGRTKPFFCSCETLNSEPAGDFVLKILGQPASGSCGPVLEFLASRLALHFGIMVPEPVAVMVDADFAGILAERWPDRSQEFQANIGYNFASQQLSPAATWAVKEPIPADQRLDALNIFAFDALIQNPDRRPENPNVLVHKGGVYVYDHELAFSFLQNLLPSATPWDLATENYLQNHLFRDGLTAAVADTAHFAVRLTELSDDVINGIRAEILPEWQHQDVATIEAHLKAVREHAAEFANAVRGRLS